MRIAIFENEFFVLANMFSLVNLRFDKKLEYFQYNTSQEGLDFVLANEIDLIIVDIHLTDRSNMDGYQLIKEILLAKPRQSFLIISGFGNVETINNGLKERGLPEFRILTKPITTTVLYEAIANYKHQ